MASVKRPSVAAGLDMFWFERLLFGIAIRPGVANHPYGSSAIEDFWVDFPGETGIFFS